MEYRTLGNSSLSVSPICFGANVFGWTLDEAQSFDILDRFVDAGFNFIDTADTYSVWVPGNKGGESETIIGRWLKRRNKRDDLVLATKLGGELGPDKKGLSAAYIRQAVEASLQRLQTDYIDLYQSHYDDPETPVEETMEAFNQLIQEGKVRFIGASNLSPERIIASNQASADHGWAAYVSLQPRYNLYDRADFESKYESLANTQHLGVINYYALASGFLSGKYRKASDADGKARGSEARKYLTERGMRILSALDDMALKHEATPAQISLAWLLHKSAVTAPIASATDAHQLQDLAQSVDISLSLQEVQTLDQASAY